MNATVADAIASYLEGLEQAVDTPVEPFGYGSDVSCVSDLDERMTELPGDSLLVLAQALARRLDCPRGALPDDPDYGIDLRGHCNRGVTTAEIRALAGQVRSELEKDDRVDRALVTVTPSPTGSSLRIEAAITPVDHRLGGFALTLAVTDAGLLLEELRRAA